MAGADYDGIAAVVRLIEAGKKPDTFAIEVVTYHAVLESEMERVICGLVRRPDELFSRRSSLGFGHKIAILKAVWKGDPAKADMVCDALVKFNDLRNAVAHPSNKDINSCHANLTIAYRAIDTKIGDEVTILEAAQGICLFLHNGINVTELKEVFGALDKVVNVDLAKSIGLKK